MVDVCFENRPFSAPSSPVCAASGTPLGLCPCHCQPRGRGSGSFCNKVASFWLELVSVTCHPPGRRQEPNLASQNNPKQPQNTPGTAAAPGGLWGGVPHALRWCHSSKGGLQ